MRKIAAFTAVATSLALSVPAQADPSLGIGFSLVLSGGKPDVAIGAKVFSNDRADRGALSVGLDYRIGAKRWRPNVGVAYLRDKGYVDVNVGYDPISAAADFGAGLGGTSGVKVPF